MLLTLNYSTELLISYQTSQSLHVPHVRQDRFEC